MAVEWHGQEGCVQPQAVSDVSTAPDLTEIRQVAATLAPQGPPAHVTIPQTPPDALPRAGNSAGGPLTRTPKDTPPSAKQCHRSGKPIRVFHNPVVIGDLRFIPEHFTCRCPCRRRLTLVTCVVLYNEESALSDVYHVNCQHPPGWRVAEQGAVMSV